MIEAPHPHSLWLVEYRELQDNDLSVTVVEAHVGTEAVDTFVGPAYPVRPTILSRVYRVIWFNYVAFCIRNESYAVAESEPQGRGLGTERASSFRDYLSKATWATDDFPGRLVHWFLNTEQHCFDVVAVDPPEIVELAGAEAAAIIASYDAANAS
jgi:hypothetical protein